MKPDSISRLSEWLDRQVPDVGDESILGVFIRLTAPKQLEFEAQIHHEMDRLSQASKRIMTSLSRIKDARRHDKRLSDLSAITRERDDLRQLKEMIDREPLSPIWDSGKIQRKRRATACGKGNPAAATRDLTIKKYRHLSAREICRKLDAELMQRDRPPTGFPASWVRLEVNGFTDAYKKAEYRNRVQKMISKAKKRQF